MKLLFINACVRGEKSRTLKLAAAYIDKFLKEKGPDWQVDEINLDKENIPIQNSSLLESRESLIAESAFSDPTFDLAKQFLEADDIIIAAPYWDLQFPALLKIYLERISVTGLTFTYNEKGFPQGMSKAKHAVYITTAGGYTTGMNYGYEYINGLFTKLFTFEKVDLIMAEGLDIVGNDPEKIISDVINNF